MISNITIFPNIPFLSNSEKISSKQQEIIHHENDHTDVEDS